MRIVIGITGASGIRLAYRMIHELAKLNIEEYVVVTDSAFKVARAEVREDIMEEIKEISRGFYKENELDAPISSGSYKTDGMVVIPCSMNTIAKLSYGISDNLLLRAADIQIKMGNKLILVPREAPVSRIHLRNLYRLSRLPNLYIIFPVLTYYHKPKSIEEMENYVIGRILDILGIEHNLYKRWKEG
jgi:4-hydroxy-3-polyprenylbenzoate decarboxylase